MSTRTLNLEPRVLSREELYRLVWTKPILSLAEEFGLSDRGLTKLCSRHSIPTPPRGYWATKEANHKVKQRPLPQSSKQVDPIVVYPSRTKRLQELAPIPTGEDQPNITVDESGGQYHEQVRSWRALARRTKVNERRLISLGDDRLPIFVSKNEIDRASRIVNALIQYFEKQGCELCWWDIRPGIRRCGFEIGKEFVAFKLEEQVGSEIKQRRERSEYGSGYAYKVPYAVYHPTGKFTLSINEYISGAPQQNWSDGKVQRVEMILGKFASAVLQIGELKRIEREHEEARRAEWEREQERITRHRAAYETEMKRVEALDSAMADHETATRIRAFVDILQSTDVVQLRRPLPDGDGDLAVWLEWAKGYADWLDPTVVSPSSVLESPPEGWE